VCEGVYRGGRGGRLAEAQPCRPVHPFPPSLAVTQVINLKQGDPFTLVLVPLSRRSFRRRRSTELYPLTMFLGARWSSLL